LMAVGVILANLVSNANVGGVCTLFCHITNIWGTAINGMLAQPYTNADCGKCGQAAPPAKGPNPPSSQKTPKPGAPVQTPFPVAAPGGPVSSTPTSKPKTCIFGFCFCNCGGTIPIPCAC